MTALKSLITTELQAADLQQLMHLWNAEFPVQISYSSPVELQAYLDGLEEVKHHLLMNEKGEIKGWFWLFERDNLPWFAMILSRDIQKQGWGKQLILWAQEECPFLNGWVVDHLDYRKADGSPYPSPLGFYTALGFRKSKDRLEVEKLSVARISWP